MTDTPSPWDIVNAPIHHVAPPKRHMTARAFAVLCAVAAIFGALYAFNH